MGWYREGEGGVVEWGRWDSGYGEGERYWKVEREYGIVVLLNSKYSVFNWGGR